MAITNISYLYGPAKGYCTATSPTHQPIGSLFQSNPSKGPTYLNHRAHQLTCPKLIISPLNHKSFFLDKHMSRNSCFYLDLTSHTYHHNFLDKPGSSCQIHWHCVWYNLARQSHCEASLATLKSFKIILFILSSRAIQSADR